MPIDGKSVFQLVNQLRYFGVGRRVARRNWVDPGTYWEITRWVVMPHRVLR